MSALRLRVVIPHFFREGASEGSGGYGSGRSGNRLPRCLALARCLGSVLALNRAPRDWILNIAEEQMELTPTSCLAGLAELQVEVHLFVCGEHWLQEVVELYAPRLQLHHLDLEDPRQLPLAAVRQLLDMPAPADLSLYLEDDLVIQDRQYADKLAWFHKRTEHRCVLMPHRHELAVAHAPQHLYVDGPIKKEGEMQPVWASDETVVASGRFWDGQDLSFVEASNPHSGSFCVSAPQLEQLRSAAWPPPDFVGPLETAATGTLLGRFPVLKTSWACREFLTLEHGNPSFLPLLVELPQRERPLGP
ncbi:hypothetical protein SynBIOSE41_00110 [Synechococcus sp. BIOS-E4-1]|uniref:hypothetical protein n=1 Tax=Synechococcus sp. BIOS-E4-1 TaxID=1400864 RepID=UPI001648E7AE|nr:hypothetical protein [Synechococcus sp. BIOS-E4-1]QNI52690.1 hypothetical protein SynBIOSE41_00110 [Synechococcus sp. BIOS-E4-1]